MLKTKRNFRIIISSNLLPFIIPSEQGDLGYSLYRIIYSIYNIIQYSIRWKTLAIIMNNNTINHIEWITVLKIHV